MITAIPPNAQICGKNRDNNNNNKKETKKSKQFSGNYTLLVRIL